MGFDRNDLIGKLPELTNDLIKRNLLTRRRSPKQKVKIYFFGDNELLFCHLNGKFLCDLTTDIVN